MKFLKLGFIFAALALFIIACSRNQNTNSTVANNTAVVVNSNANKTSATTPAADELASAKKIYSEKCIKCHKEDGTGGVTDIEGTKIKAPSFAGDRMKKASDSDLVEVIENGAKEDGMPAFKGKISDDDIKNLVKLIRRDFQK